jgi:ERF superfamily protein
MSTDLAKTQETAVERQPARSMTETFREILIHNPDIEVNRLREMAELLKWAEERDASKAFSEAMRLAQEEMRPIVRNAENSQTHSQYATMDAIDEIIRPIYVKHGLSLSFNSPGFTKEGVTISCVVSHTLGHREHYSLQGELDMAGPQGKANKTPIQGLSSSISYLQRILTRMIFNLTFKNADKDGREQGYVNAHEMQALGDLMHEMSFSPAAQSKFLETFGAKALSEIPKGAYVGALNLLEAKRRSMGVKEK